MYIWDLELKSFSFGWQKTIDRFGSENFRERRKDAFICNPVTYKKLLENNFHSFTAEARQILKKENVDLHRLFTLDLLLWGLIWDYTRPDNEEIMDKGNDDYLKTFEIETFADETAMFLAYEDYEDYFRGDNILKIDGTAQKVQKIMELDIHSQDGITTAGIRLEKQKAGYSYDEDMADR